VTTDLLILACGLLFFAGIEATVHSALTPARTRCDCTDRDNSRTPVARPRPGIRDLAKETP
jgi:hypothetical protein